HPARAAGKRCRPVGGGQPELGRGAGLRPPAARAGALVAARGRPVRRPSTRPAHPAGGARLRGALSSLGPPGLKFLRASPSRAACGGAHGRPRNTALLLLPVPGTQGRGWPCPSRHACRPIPRTRAGPWLAAAEKRNARRTIMSTNQILCPG